MLTLLHSIFISQLNRPTNPLRIFQRKFVTCVAVRRCINNRYLSSQQFEALGRAHTHTQLEALRRSEAFVSWCACAQPLRPTALIDCALTASLFPLLPLRRLHAKVQPAEPEIRSTDAPAEATGAG